jgi:arylformamidase
MAGEWETPGGLRDVSSTTSAVEGISAGSVHDISVILGEESIDYPGDTPYSRDLAATIQNTGDYALSKLTMSPHCGTHIDAPAHFIQDGKTIDEFPVQTFILPALVVEIEDNETIDVQELESLHINAGEALLFKTENSRRGLSRAGVFTDEFVYLSLPAAEFCVERRLGLIGIDYITIEQYGAKAFPVHRKILAGNMLVLEGIDLSGVDAGRYTLMCFPLKIKGCEASPVRAILLA